MGTLAQNQLLIFKQNVLTNFLILHCIVMEKGPTYGKLKYKQLSL